MNNKTKAKSRQPLNFSQGQAWIRLSLTLSITLAGGKTVDASQEMVALGVCNLLGSFVQSMPTTGSFSRQASPLQRSRNCSEEFLAPGVLPSLVLYGAYNRSITSIEYNYHILRP